VFFSFGVLPSTFPFRKVNALLLLLMILPFLAR